MHGLIIRSFEGFLRNTYGAEVWDDVTNGLDAGIDRFEPMFHYDDALAARLVEIAAARLGKPADGLFEDFGIYLVTHPSSERVRRLLRFGGVDYEDFLGSLEDLAGRARLAVPDLELPRLDLVDLGVGEYRLSLVTPLVGAAPVYLGLLRALADDYGALVMIVLDGRVNGAERLSIRLLKADFAQGRGFALADDGTGVAQEGGR